MAGRGNDIDELNKIEREFWDWRLEDSPEFATLTGNTKYNDRLRHFGLDLFKPRNDKVEGFLKRVKALDSSGFNQKQLADYLIFKDSLQTYVDGYKWRNHNPLNPFNFLEGLTANPDHFVDTTPFISRGDFENFIERLQKIPKQFDEQTELLREAIKLGNTYNNASVKAVPGQIDEHIVTDLKTSIFYKPFLEMLDKSSVPEIFKATMRERALKAISNIMVAYKDLKHFIINDYMPRTRTTWGISGWTDGAKDYEACLKWHLSLEMTPKEVHDKGLQEVERIQKVMKETMKRIGFNGTIPEFYKMIRENPKFHFKSADILLKGYDDIIYKEIFPKLHQLFKDIPNLPLSIQRMPYDGAGGEYLSGTADGSRPGVFYVNLRRPEQKATIDMMSLSLHETVPGHHLQSIYALTASLPDYRKFQEDSNYYQPPLKFPFYTAYLEGWGLYSEYLGEELGLYTDDYVLMGRYGAEIFRAARLVVDTGLHHYNWTRDQCIKYMLDRTAYGQGEIENEIDRYMTWPGQACAYKIGELKIKELREKAKNALGSRFDVRSFHSVVLENGPVPLTTLEMLVENWIKTESQRQVIIGM
ncbi:hypothetical protein LOTGIDRAFT_157979 [Lottia gigantea]|uniref:DUF885 domain-containing protein n=1 Tax=Lottia gigantea TaxID=225164 RepID=V4A9M0_LOTGI|nr:hypothetical protein LOTGIDRAFT_157979 [Lottia gigantea]ESP00689.1 hypothetical protein LOTGIDRAFT_157979 [Lottia gigantea]